MKKAISLVFLIASLSCFSEPIGHMQIGTEEVELYGVSGGCSIAWDKRTETGGYLLSRYQQGSRHRYVMGCWKPIDDSRVRAVFDDGVVMILHRKQLVPVGRISL